MEVLFKTIHGSRLYGLNNENSDEDFYTVVRRPVRKSVPGRQPRARYARQTIIGDEDSMVVDFGTWIEMCKSGVPQALEAMFSDMIVEDHISHFRQSFRAGTTAWPKYLDTIKSFALNEEDLVKKKRHALRLALNFNEMSNTGRFNPTLSVTDAEVITYLAEHNNGPVVYDVAKILAWR